MTVTVFPVDAVSGSPLYTAEHVRQALSVLAGVAPSSRPLGATSAVRPGTPTTTVSATSSTWTVGPHAGVLDKETSAGAGPYWYAVDANVTGSVTAADATNPRIDLISVQLSDPAESDGSSTPGVAFVYTAGTAASSPSPPATPARAMALAQIAVPASGGGSPSVTWVAPYFTGSGGILPVPNSGSYPASPYEGLIVDDAALNCLLRWSGSAWDPIVRAVDASTQVVQQPTGVVDIHTVSPTTYGTRTVTRPPWASHCIVQWNFVGIYENASTNGGWHLYGLVSSGTGNVGSGGVSITGIGDGIRFSVGWSERYSSVTDATVTLTWGGYRGVSGANLRADTSTWLTASVIWQP